MNHDAMENDPQSPEILRLKEELGALAQTRERSDYACECSWTRISACLREEAPSREIHLWRWAAIGSCAVLVTLLTYTHSTSGSGPIAESRNPQIWVSGFHSSQAQADVVWATGYDYLPASYPVK